MADPFLGEITLFAGNFAPRGWAFCDGSLLSIAQNTALFSLLGTIYGGNGQTTFALPDLRGRAPIHAGRGPGLSDRSQGETGGTEQNILTIQQMPSHGHSLNSKEEANSDNASGTFIAGTGANSFGTTADKQMSPAAVGSVGGNQPINNMQPYLAINFIIALEGIYPSRN